MPHFADPVRAPSARKSASRPAAARPQPRRLRPSQQAALWQVLQLKAAERAAAAPAPAPLSRGGLPERLKAGVEALSGFAMDDVRIHRNSPEPAKLGALAFTRGSDIHLGPGKEQHLPHEAWHVVQQKQGRVRATAQLKGVGVNDDVALEAEADRMGECIRTNPPANSQSRPRVIATPADTIQKKVEYKRYELHIPKTGASPAMTFYMQRPERYLIRDDWKEGEKGKYGNAYKGKAFQGVGYFDTVFHVLDMTKAYLIAEEHDPDADLKGTSRWATTIKLWSKANKMSEAHSTIPAIDMPGSYSDPKNPNRLPLENDNAKLLMLLMLIHQSLNIVTWSNAERELKKSKPVIEDIKDWISQVYGFYPMYEFYCKLYRVTKEPRTPRKALIYAFSESFVKYYKKDFEKLEKLLEDLRPDTLNALIKLRAFVITMATSLLEINDIRDPNEAATLKGYLTRARADRDKMVKAINPVRERAMVQNIKEAEFPLLVQIGENHVANVSEKLGALAIPVPLEQSLEDFTRAPKGK